MKSNRLMKHAGPGAAVVLALTCLAATVAGGFQLRVHVPESDDSVVIVRTYGCAQPSKAKLSATAEGLVDGERVSIPIKLKSIDTGVYSVAQQWPDEGTWALAITGLYRRHISSALVELMPDGKVAVHKVKGEFTPKAEIVQRKLTQRDIDDLLFADTGAPQKRTSVSGGS